MEKSVFHFFFDFSFRIFAHFIFFLPRYFDWTDRNSRLINFSTFTFFYYENYICVFFFLLIDFIVIICFAGKNIAVNFNSYFRILCDGLCVCVFVWCVGSHYFRFEFGLKQFETHTHSHKFDFLTISYCSCVIVDRADVSIKKWICLHSSSNK